MHTIAILVKTYKGDLEYVTRLVDSFNLFNRDRIPMYIVAPEAELDLFRRFCNQTIETLSEESVTNQLARESVAGIRPGYINQEIIKLAFWEKRLCENYFCVDSDGVFVRDFFITDLMYDTQTPYTILLEDNELKVEPEYYSTYWEGRIKLIRNIQNLVGLPETQRILTCHGFGILSSKVLESLSTKFLKPRSWSYIDLLRESPYEFSWYNLWLQKDKTIEIHVREPLFKTFHHKSHHVDYMIKGITTTDLARGYIGVVINSNYSRDFGVVSLADAPHEHIANYFSTKVLFKGLFLKIKRKFACIFTGK